MSLTENHPLSSSLASVLFLEVFSLSRQGFALITPNYISSKKFLPKFQTLIFLFKFSLCPVFSTYPPIQRALRHGFFIFISEFPTTYTVAFSHLYHSPTTKIKCEKCVISFCTATYKIFTAMVQMYAPQNLWIF